MSVWSNDVEKGLQVLNKKDGEGYIQFESELYWDLE